MDDEIKFVGDMQRVEVRPGDLFVFQPGTELTYATEQALREYWAKVHHPDKPPKLVVLRAGDHLGVMGEASTPSRESSDELAALAAKYLAMNEEELLMADERALERDIKRLAGSVVSQARGDK